MPADDRPPQFSIDRKSQQQVAIGDPSAGIGVLQPSKAGADFMQLSTARVDSLQLSSPSLTADDSTTGSDISRTTTGSSGDFSRTTTGSSGEIPAMLAEVRAKCVGRNNKGVTWGFTSVIGRRKEMEDAVAVIPGFIARKCDHVGGCAASGSRTSSEISPVHFFGVSWEEDHFEAEPDEVSDQTIDEIYSQLQLHDHHVTRTSSDTMQASGEVPAKLPKKMKKSASTKSPFSHFAAEDIVESRRPATVKEKKTKAGDHEDDEEVRRWMPKPMTSSTGSSSSCRKCP